MQELAQEPGVAVLEYAYDEPEQRASPEMCCKCAREVFLLRRRDHEALSDHSAGLAIVTASPVLASFSRSHPRVFANMLSLEIGARALEMLEKLARIRAEADSSGMSEEEALIHANRVIMERTLRDPTEAERSSFS